MNHSSGSAWKGLEGAGEEGQGWLCMEPCALLTGGQPQSKNSCAAEGTLTKERKQLVGRSSFLHMCPTCQIIKHFCINYVVRASQHLCKVGRVKTV